jgi:hypothetical protein
MYFTVQLPEASLASVEIARVLFSSGLPGGATQIFNISCEIAVIFDIHIYLFSKIPWPNIKSLS